MQFLATLSLALVGLASAAVIPGTRVTYPPDCDVIYWDVGELTDKKQFGWGCWQSTNGTCVEYYWKEGPPYWSCLQYTGP